MENITIRLKKQPGAHAEEISVQAGSTIEEIIRDQEIETEYPVYAARINNTVHTLLDEPGAGDEVVLLDIRDNCAKEIFQRSIIDLFRCAIAKTFPEAKVTVGNSLNRGIFMEVKRERGFGVLAVEKTEWVMKQMAKEKVPFSMI